MITKEFQADRAVTSLLLRSDIIFKCRRSFERISNEESKRMLINPLKKCASDKIMIDVIE
jgi:hypothetical protein